MTFKQALDLGAHVRKCERGSPSVALSPGQTAMSLGTASCRDAGAFSFNLTHRFNASMPLYLSAGYANGGGTAHVGRAAMTVVW